MPRSAAALALLILGLWTSTSARAEAPPERLTYRTVAGQALSAYVFRPEAEAGGDAMTAQRPAVVLTLHGGGWVAGAPDWTFVAARRFARLGLTAVALEYRLSTPGASPSRTTPADALSDVCAGLAWARRNEALVGQVPMAVAIYGVSAGGHLAAATATVGCGDERGPDALLLWSAALDVERDGWFVRLTGGREAAQALSPMAYLKPLPPTILIHGERDSLTPADAARRFCEAANIGASRCSLHLYAGAGHLLTRNLQNQESDFDPDPEAVADGQRRLAAFLARWPAP